MLQYFYEEQLHRMELMSQEPVLFEDVLCQMHDMLLPAKEGIFTLRDLKRNKGLAGTLFNILFNLNKFVAFETRDPFTIRQVPLPEPALCMLPRTRPHTYNVLEPNEPQHSHWPHARRSIIMPAV